MNRVLQVFLDSDLRGGHASLAEVANKQGVNVNRLQPGQHLVFVNKRITKMKVYSSRGVLSYLSREKRIDLSCLSYFTDCFGAEGFQYDKALKKVLEERLGVRG